MIVDNLLWKHRIEQDFLLLQEISLHEGQSCCAELPLVVVNFTLSHTSRMQ